MKNIKIIVVLLVLICSIFTVNYINAEVQCIHIDEDGNGYICDLCDEFIGSDLVLGENNIILNKELHYLRFIPDETTNYWIYSLEYDQASVSLLDENFELIEHIYTSNGFGISLNYELKEENTYYLSFSKYYDIETIVMLNLTKHSHHGTNQDCNGYLCDECHDYYGETGEHILAIEQTCIGYLCYTCHEYVGEANKYGYSFWDGECELCGMLEEDYVCEHEGDEQTCKGYFCYHCYSWYGEASSEHNLTEYKTCKGYECVDCGQYFGDTDPNNHSYNDGVCILCGHICEHFGGEQTCKGYECEECTAFYGEPDESKHIWYYGRCEYHDVSFPSGIECTHNWNNYGSCRTCGLDCEHKNIDENNGLCNDCNY